ncbi:MAG TPA: cytochrome C oxidase subunit IV family protein [Gammaproteobacteria bacterium]|nr:cytochrome C oxidase subunit IV family protein [Gammaproteobacteria bacterium]
MSTATGQQHPLKIYFLVWGLLFLFSAASYATDFLQHGYFRWALILLFMLLKAGFIIAIFMHMAWERKALIWAILGPPVVLLVLIGLMVVEGDYTELTRLSSFSAPIVPAGHAAEEARH